MEEALEDANILIQLEASPISRGVYDKNEVSPKLNFWKSRKNFPST
jgi:hypothetical protein